MKVPPPLRRGDLVIAVAPSSPFEHVLGWRGLGFLATRYRVRFDRGLFSRQGYLAGSPERRLSELQAALDDPEARAVIAVRGGVGMSHLIHRLDFGELQRNPKWIVGFSDITALHVELGRLGIASLHASHITALGRSDHPTRSGLVDALEDPFRARSFTGLSVVVPGRASGPLFGGNLALLHAAAASGRLAVPAGAVLFLEDVTERPYRIDRMLTNLTAGGHFQGISAICLGEFVGCAPGPDGVSVEAVLAEVLRPLAVPTVAGLPVGHGLRNEPIFFGAYATVDAGSEGAALQLALPQP